MSRSNILLGNPAIDSNERQALINPITQEVDAIAGLNYVSDTILQFRVLQQVYVDNLAKSEVVDENVQKIWVGVRDNTVVLYCQILEYQFKMAAQYCRSSGIQFARDFIKQDSWKGYKDGIEKTQSNIMRYIEVSCHCQFRDEANNC